MSKPLPGQLSIFEPTADKPRQENAGLFTSSDEPTPAYNPRQETAGPITSARVFAADPGQKPGKDSVIITPAGEVVVSDLQAFVLTCERGDKIATESTVHLYRNRLELIRAADERGVELWAMRPIFTYRARLEIGLQDKTDENDARGILHYFRTRNALFYRLKAEPVRLGKKHDAGTVRCELNSRLVMLRICDYPGYEDLHEATRVELASLGAKYNMTSRGFDRFCGFNGCGYGNIARSNRNKHYAGKCKDKVERNRRMAEYRKATRALFQELKRSKNAAL